MCNNGHIKEERQFEMDTKPPTSVYHHHRAPRTPESYFNVPESIALLNIVKSERIQNAFQSNRKNHASVWEMVAEVLNRYSARKRSAKQCCNRYENLKKIYTQLKKNPERHVRRNWPYMFLFKEIEEQRGESWGSNSKRLALINKNHNELSYYHRRRQAAEFGALVLDKQTQAAVVAQQNLLQTLAAQSNDSNSNASKTLERFLPNHFVEAELGCPESAGGGGGGGNGEGNANVMGNGGVNDSLRSTAVDLAVPGLNPALYDGASPLALQAMRKEHQHHQHELRVTEDDMNEIRKQHHNHHNLLQAHTGSLITNGVNSPKDHLPTEYEKDCNGALNLQTNDNNISMKSEPMSEGEFNPDDIQLMSTNYNGIDTNILHPDVIVDTDNLSECSSNASPKSKRKLSTSTDGDSTNYELIEYLKRREKRDEELLKRMDAREERLLNLLERTVLAIEALAHKSCNQILNSRNSNEVTVNNNNNTSTILTTTTAETGTTTTTPTIITNANVINNATSSNLNYNNSLAKGYNGLIVRDLDIKTIEKL
uniref:Myb/SANT-like DNA-binding domain-containing protein n=1 Tax=Glossina brevipalpis TaxID=37001 RepID=A0A1A9WDQ7_9MUSC